MSKERYELTPEKKQYIADAAFLAPDRHLKRIEEIRCFGEEKGYITSDQMRFLDTLFFNF